MEADPFDQDFSDLSEDDFRILNEATQFMNLSGPSEPTATVSVSADAQEVARMRQELALAKQTAENLEKAMIQVQQQKMTREGEVSILRERLAKNEAERGESLNRANEKVHQAEQSRQALEADYKRTVEALKSELAFKDHELESLSSRMDHLKLSSKTAPGGFAKERRVVAPVLNVPEGFEDFAQACVKKRSAQDPVLFEEHPEDLVIARPVATAPPATLTERQRLDQAIEYVDYISGRFLDYDLRELLEQKEKTRRLLDETHCLVAALEMTFDSVLSGLRQSILLYFTRVTAAAFMMDPLMALKAYNRGLYPAQVASTHPQYTSCRLLPKLCAFLERPPFGLHPMVLKAHLDIFKCCLMHMANSVPLEIKALLEGGMLAECLNNLLENEELLLDHVQLMFMMSKDRTAVSLFLKPFAPPVQVSMLALLVKVGIEHFKTTKPDDRFLSALLELLMMLSRKNLVPLHVAFDRRLLREIVRCWREKARTDTIDYESPMDYDLPVRVLYYVFVEKAADLCANLGGLYFSLFYMAEQMLLHPGHSAEMRRMLDDLFRVSNAAVEGWIRTRDEGRAAVPENLQIKLKI